jgi:hypothetical protein
MKTIAAAALPATVLRPGRRRWPVVNDTVQELSAGTKTGKVGQAIDDRCYGTE